MNRAWIGMHGNRGATADEGMKALGKLAVFQGVSAYPIRVKCASMAWHTLKGILERGG